MSAPLSFAAYGRHRGCSTQAVQKAYKAKRLVKSIVMQKGIPKIRSAAEADAEWTANTDTTRLPIQRAAAAPSAPAQDPPETPAAASWRERKEAAQAQLEEHKLAVMRGEYVLAAEVEHKIADEYTAIRTRLLGIPTTVRQQMPELSGQQIDKLDAMIRECLEELSAVAVAHVDA